ncbi:hypothetical protein Nepgr_029100 [Nepenthes gracilis]|uniref:Uncharacterized protein n=1 Tax=Nepenthes gracilis TaxID=150966 RepID=A0AAD3TET9_NEPGR|nr:hypothetical protein Nepgr_029100 [Nepenthes gracilis]
MEPAKINWKTIDSEFVRDDVYEHINAPQWTDFLAPQDSVDDEAWFCRPDCKHPTTAEEFLKRTPTSKPLRSVSVSKIIGVGDWNRRNGNLDRRALAQSSTLSSTNEDCENQNPNLSTPTCQINPLKGAITQSEEKKKKQDDNCSEIMSQNDVKPMLKSTLSARDLFGGKDILDKITEYCNELKRMATRVKREDDSVAILKAKKSSIESNGEAHNSVFDSDSEKLKEKEKDRKPLLHLSKERERAKDRSNAKEKNKKKKRADEAENIPVFLDLKNIKHEDEKSFLLIRTSPPTPQCFLATCDPAKTTAATPSKGLKSRLMDVLQEVEQNKESSKEVAGKNNGRNAPTMAAREGKTLDIFWFLKPCTLSS